MSLTNLIDQINSYKYLYLDRLYEENDLELCVIVDEAKVLGGEPESVANASLYGQIVCNDTCQKNKITVTQLTRCTVLAIAAWLSCYAVAAQSKFIVWPKEPGRRIRPAGTPGGQANALAQFDSFEIEQILVEGKPIIIGQPFNASDDWL